MNLHLVAGGLVAVVILIHLYIVVLEMLLWKTPYGRKAFGMTPEFARESRVLAANQGLYNGFLAAGLIWGLAANKFDVTVFFLACVIVAGIFGGITASRRILLVQALPGVVALVFVWLAHRMGT
jgi:putative membrane protein